MSLPWSKLVLLRIKPSRIEAVLSTSWPKQDLLAATEYPVPAEVDIPIDAASTASLESRFAVGIESSLQTLELRASLRGARLRVELDDALVHLDVVTGDFAGQSDSQLQTIALACVNELLGSDAAAHEVRWGLQAGDGHLLICAVPRRWINAVESAARLRGMTLNSIQPRFPLCWNESARDLVSETSVVVVTSEHQAVIACVVRRAICAISIGHWAVPALPGAGSSSAAAAAGSRSAFALDDQVDRLLASLGVGEMARPDYLLVTDGDAPVAASARWSVVATPRLAA